MKKFLLVTVFLITNYSYVYSESNVNPIIEGNVDAKIHLIICNQLNFIKRFVQSIFRIKYRVKVKIKFSY
mgnify:CR=1 FL=1